MRELRGRRKRRGSEAQFMGRCWLAGVIYPPAVGRGIDQGIRFWIGDSGN
jgi:hypothetical protein